MPLNISKTITNLLLSYVVNELFLPIYIFNHTIEFSAKPDFLLNL